MCSFFPLVHITNDECFHYERRAKVHLFHKYLLRTHHVPSTVMANRFSSEIRSILSLFSENFKSAFAVL